MEHKRIISLLLSFLMLFSLLASNLVFADNTDKGQREVYLHAQGENPKETVNLSTVYLGDTVNLYFAIDNPNKGTYEKGVHKEPQYDLNGYTVKIYFDSAYFDYAKTAKTGSSNPIDYTIPDKNIPQSESGSEDIGDDTVNNTPTTVGYYVYSHGSGAEELNGKTYKTAYATIFFSGEYVPQKKDGQLWYNLCAVPLTPLKTGNSDVFLEIGTADAHTLELFAKNVNDDYPPNFDFTAINGGYHHITIKDKLKPAAPVANPVSGSYTKKQTVALNAEENCDIYYSIDSGNTYVPYTKPIDIEITTKILCYAERKSDGKRSNTVSYEYKIIPEPPYLFDSQKGLIPNVYNEDKAFTVYAADKNVFGNIADDSEVYYTFSNADAENMTIGSNPEKEWVKVDKQTQSIEINKKRTVRLITIKSNVNGDTRSDISWYYLGIKPARVIAEPDSGIYDEIIDVALSCETTGAEIYYTTDGGDPRTDGILYTTPLTFNKDTTLRAASFYDGEWSDISSYWYIFNITDDYAVDAFYPSGVYEGNVNVTLTPHNPENRVVYSLDGGKTWIDYTDTITLDSSSEIIAKAIDKNGKEGGEYKFTYTIKPLPPAFAPESTQFTNADEITVYCPETTSANTDDYELIYTLDGTDPTTSSTAIIADAKTDTAVIDITGYTVVTAVVRKNGTTYSTVVSHSYDIVTSKPVKPLTTLLPGYYTRKIDGDDFFTQFMPVPTGTTIYYTVSYGGEVNSDPVPGMDGTIEYNNEYIPVKGKTIIKAVAVNSFGAKSDIGIFEYTVTPEAPVAAPSATISGDRLPVVPVSAVEGSTVKYKIGDFENEFVNDGGEVFYIDTATGNAYRDKECTESLGNTSDKTNDKTAILEISAELDGISSQPNTYVYVLSDDDVLAPPYADKKTGTYEEINIDGENNLLIVKLYSLNSDDEIFYMTDNSGKWKAYNGSEIKLSEDTVLQIRSQKGDKYSKAVSYVYEFVPLSPIITLPSGRYSQTPVPTTRLKFDDRAPTNKDYSIWYRSNGDTGDVRYNPDVAPEREIEHTMSFKAYVINYGTGRKSANTIHYYIIEPANAADGSVYTAYPYEVYPGDTKYIAAHLLDKADYNKGIKLYTQKSDAKIKYFYTYTRADGSGTAATETYIYDNALPIFVNSSMADISVTAWLIDSDGNEIEGTKSVFNYVFVDLLVPETSLTKSGKTEFEKDTEYTILNDYPNDDDILIYYTLDGSDPTDSKNDARKLYNGEKLKITESVTVKTVYYKACGRCTQCKDGNITGCTNSVYGETGTYRYTVPTVKTVSGGSSGGGGSRTIDNTRKYTVDIFGNEHPTHIGYINGYPDGSVQPDGYITREEVTAILYRIKNHEYEKPFASTGEVFPDVEQGRWSVTEIEYMADKDVVYGYPDGEFKPSRNLTRAEFAALIFRFTGIEKAVISNTFSDLESTHWAYSEILSLCNEGLVEGYEDRTYRPENNITRAEVMTVVNKILGRNPSEEYVKSLDFNPFNDLDINKWYYVTVIEATITHNYYLDKTNLEIKWEDWK